MKLVKRYFSVFLVMILIFSGVYTGAEAATVSDLTIYNGTVINCNKAANGSIVIPDTVHTIGSGAFSECAKLTTIIIQSSVTKIENRAFEKCSSLIKVEISGENVTMGDNVFYDCTTLSDVTLPKSLKAIGKSSFCGCSSLKSVSIPSTVEKISEKAFMESGIESVSIPAATVSIGPLAFAGCKDLLKISVSPDNKSYKSDASGVLYTYDGNELIQYPSAKSLTKYVIADGTKKTDELSFSKSKSLTEIVLPTSMEEIESYTFSECENLSIINFNEGLKTIKNLAFNGCSSLNEVTIPSSVEKYESAFYNCAIKKATIKNGVNAIDREAFESCVSLEEVIIPASVTSIEKGAFKNCTSLKRIEIPVGVTNIDKNAFLNIEDSITLCVVDGSYAAQFAKDNDIKYETDYYILSFDANGGTFSGNPQLSFIIKANDAINIMSPGVPSKKGYIFTGWDEIPQKMPSQSITLKANWIAETNISIDNNCQNKEIKYGDILSMTVTVKNPVSNGNVYWYIGQNYAGKGNSFEFTEDKGEFTITAVAVDKDGHAVKNSAGEDVKTSIDVNIKKNIIWVIVSFFKNLFKADRKVYL